MKVEIKRSTYRGRPIIQLFDKDSSPEYQNYPILSVGVRKATAILAVVDEIKKFVKDNKEQ